MTSANQPADILNFDEGQKKLPDMLNVLTILTFVGCGVGCIASVYSFSNAQKSYDDVVRIQDKLEDAPGIVKRLAGPKMAESARHSLEQKLPLRLLAMWGSVVCGYGVTV